MLGWHFCRNDKKLGFGDGRRIRTSGTLKVEPPIVLCKKGLHASKNILDALSYSQGNIICRVKLGGKIIHDTDKSVATERTVLSMINGTNTLHEFACLCAERVLKRAKIKDNHCWNAIKIKRKWLKGEASGKELGAARGAAWDAAWVAAGIAARGAAWEAARDAAWAAAWAAAGAAERRWQNKTLSKLVKSQMALFKK